MDDNLTYKTEEVYGDQLNSYLYSIYFNLYTIFIEDLADDFYNVGELIGKTLCEFANDISKNKRILPAKCIKPIHKAPVYKITPYVRNRC